MVPKLAKLEPINTKRTTIPMFNCWKLKTADLDVSMVVTQLSLSVTLSSLFSALGCTPGVSVCETDVYDFIWD